MKVQPEKYLKYLLPNLSELFGTQRTREILSVNPTVVPKREEAQQVVITACCYTKDAIEEHKNISLEQALDLRNSNKIVWINVDGLRKADVEKLGERYGINPLLQEDILSIDQRAKMDEIDSILFCLINTLYFNEQKKAVEHEQISMVLGKRMVITFQEDLSRDPFNALRERLKLPASKTRTRDADYLYYTLLDTIVDNYFIVMEKLGKEIEGLEAEIIKNTSKRTLAYINAIRKELIVLKRMIYPVREVISGLLKSESELLEESNERYYKDVLDHIVQAIDLVDNYKDVAMSMQDLYLNNVNLKLNEVMKVMAVVTCLLAPATIITGIFGMNFKAIPLLENNNGFWIAIGFMILILIWMLSIFRRKRWF
ncbi:magnesium/cobalt transporter CorA [Niabella soli]|uniref:Magnesium transport protein CorA n=1 Tax=Niabella soli DSM 19437 TaxID=929713 RepID=W0EZU1_9BACT|nr:magnesium/cobalt transporter CorA [Niabella soli]AHF16267.1 magnesium transporter [Niabella soli DSM 19437]